MNDLDALHREALAAGRTALAAQARFLDALRARDRFSSAEEYRAHRAAMRDGLRVARGIASAALAAYYAASRNALA